MAKRICLDAGHYGKYNRSPVVPAYYESDMNWKLHLLLKKELESYGFEVITTRADKDKDLALESRGKAAKGCDLFLSLHSNAASSESVNYVVCMHQVDDNCGAIDEQSKNIADLLATTVADIMRVKPMVWASPSSVDRNGDGYKDDYYGVLRGAHSVNVAGVILEHGFHTNKAQTEWLLKDSNLQRLAEAEASVLAKYFGMTKEPEHWYRIRKTWEDAKSQIAAYKDLASAKKACPEGYTVFDWNGKAVYTNKPAPKPITYTLTLPLLRKGDSGEAVEALQHLLLANGIKLPKYGADGDFGEETEKGVKEYQRKVGLKEDGEVGHDTMGSLLGV